MIGGIDIAQKLEIFFQSIFQFVQLLSFIDYVLIGALFIFVIRGFILGAAKIIIHGIWLILALVLATIFYKFLTEALALSSFMSTIVDAYFLGFMLIIILVYVIKYVIYRTLEKIAVLHGPCPLNRFLALFIGYAIIISLSWYIALDIHSTPLLVNILMDDIIRFAISFMLIFTVSITISYVLMTLLNVKVGIDRPCPLLKALQPLDDILNAKSINSLSNSLGGAIIGILQAFVVTIIFLMVLHLLGFQIDTTNQNATSIAKELNSISLSIYGIFARQFSFL